jgi:uncharacterized protein YidB (DUF937 family)
MNRNALTALLGVLAVAGYQNRDKIREMLGGMMEGAQNRSGQDNGLGGLLGGLAGSRTSGGLGDLLAGGSLGGLLNGGLGGLLEQFEKNGQGETAKSWVETGPNAPIDDRELSQALGPDLLQELSARTGLQREEILSRLTRDLPMAVNDLTPDGEIPSASSVDSSLPGGQSVPSIGRGTAI